MTYDQVREAYFVDRRMVLSTATLEPACGVRLEVAEWRSRRELGRSPR